MVDPVKEVKKLMSGGVDKSFEAIGILKLPIRLSALRLLEVPL